jgi:hypothetical protein
MWKGILKVALRRVWRVTKLLSLTALLLLSVLAGLFSSLYIGEYLRLQSNQPCVVPGFTTVSCTRLEGENDYLYVVIVERGTDQAIINYKVSKLRKIFVGGTNET